MEETTLPRRLGRPPGTAELQKFPVSLRPDQLQYLREVSREDAIPVAVLIREALDYWIDAGENGS